MKKRVAILISGRGSNMAALIEAASAPDYPAAIALVISNRPEAKGIERARAAGLPALCVDHKTFGEDRAAFERALEKYLAEHAIDIVCLAGFMRLLTPEFTERWRGRMINIHPSLLPCFKGTDTHARALEAGVRIHGASVHFVTADMDSGPIIAQAAVPIGDGDDKKSLAARVLAVEHRLYPLALRLVAEGRVSLEGNRCRVNGDVDTNATLIVPEK